MQTLNPNDVFLYCAGQMSADLKRVYERAQVSKEDTLPHAVKVSKDVLYTPKGHISN